MLTKEDRCYRFDSPSYRSHPGVSSVCEQAEYDSEHNIISPYDKNLQLAFEDREHHEMFMNNWQYQDNK